MRRLTSDTSLLTPLAIHDAQTCGERWREGKGRENKRDHFRFQSTKRIRDRDSESDSLSLCRPRRPPAAYQEYVTSLR